MLHCATYRTKHQSTAESGVGWRSYKGMMSTLDTYRGKRTTRTRLAVNSFQTLWSGKHRSQTLMLVMYKSYGWQTMPQTKRFELHYINYSIKALKARQRMQISYPIKGIQLSRIQDQKKLQVLKTRLRFDQFFRLLLSPRYSWTHQ